MMKKRVWAIGGAATGGAIAVAEVLLYVFWAHIDGNDPPPTLEQQLAFVAGVGLFLLPHVLALLSRGRSRALLAGAGVCAVTMGVLSILDPVIFLGAVIVELIPGIVYLVRAAQPGPGTRRKAVLGIVLPVLLVAATASIVLINEYQCYEYVKFRDGTVRYHSVPATETGFSFIRGSGSGRQVVESGGGCGGVHTFRSSLPALALMGTVIGIGFYARRSTPMEPVLTPG